MTNTTPHYYLGHVLSQKTSGAGNYRTKTTNYASTPIEVEVPKRGKTKYTFVCSQCNTGIDVYVLSKMNAFIARLIKLGWGLAGIGLWYLLNYLSAQYKINIDIEHGNPILTILFLLFFLALAGFIYKNLVSAIFLGNFEFMFEFGANTPPNHTILKK